MAAFRVLVQALAVACLVLIAIDVAFARLFPHTVRLADNFSSFYLAREIRAIDARDVVVSGDSAFWGYGVTADEAALSILRARGAPIENLSYEGGSPANTYAVLKAITVAGIHPRRFVFNVNLKEFNATDSAYARLYPGVEELVWPELTGAQRARLQATQSQGFDARTDRAIGERWALYGMRADLRYLLFGDVDAAHRVLTLVERTSGAALRDDALHRATPDRFEQTYDLSPIDPQNTSLAFLRDTLDLARRYGLPIVAVLTPTNHRLLHAYIDAPEYDANLETLRRALRRGGAAVVDLDRRFSGDEFIDNDHLNVRGNRHLAALLANATAP